jgi:hypothetical protein
LGFLGPSRFCPGRPENKGWISLDFLGFSRPNRDFSMGYAGFLAEENCARPFAAGAAAPGQERYSYDAEMQYDSSSKPANFLYFCNQLLATEIDDSLLSPRDTGAPQFFSRVRCRAKGTVFANPS